MSATLPIEAAPRRLLITFCVMGATLLQTLDSTIANVALPYMQGPLAASQDQISWVLTSYIVSVAIMTAPTGFLAARYGRTRVFVVSTIGFTIASMCCGLAQSLDQIVVFRIAQGLLGGALVPLSQATLLDVYPIEQRATAMAIFITGAFFGPILGPTLGGWLTGNLSWRWVFYINVPLGLLVAVSLSAFLEETPHNTSVKLDWTGFAALSLGVGMLQTLVDRGETLDWFNSREIQLEAIFCGIGFYIFLVQSMLAPKPFLSPRLCKDLNFMSACVIVSVHGLILYASMALLAPYLQVLMNYPVATAGLVMAPRGAGAMLAAVICGRLMATINPRYLLATGFLLTIGSLYVMTAWTPDVSSASVTWTGFVQGMGSSFISVPLTTIAFASLAPELRTEGTSVFSLMRSLGSSIGISVMAALLTSNIQENHEIISSAVTPFNRALQAGMPLKLWNPGSAHGAALLDATITRQSSIIAYTDDFKLLLLLSSLAVPLVLVMRISKKTAILVPPQ